MNWTGRTRIPGLFLGVLLVLGAPKPTNALLLDWAAEGWPGGLGDRNEIFVINGNNVEVTIMENGGSVINGATEPLGSPGSISVGTFLNPTTNTSGPNLFVKSNSNPGSIDITFDFDEPLGVTGLSFNIFDVDREPPGAYVDVLNITGLDTVGGLITPSNIVIVPGQHLWDGASRVEATPGVAADQEAGNSDIGTILVEFNTALVEVDSITISYTNEFAGVPGDQWIGIGDITYTAIPEPTTGLLMALGLLGLATGRRILN